MVLRGDTLFVAGPPDLFTPAANETVHPYHIESAEALKEQAAALDGKRGGTLLALSADTGKQLAKHTLQSPPAWDGMSAARSHLFVSLEDGSVVCYEGR